MLLLQVAAKAAGLNRTRRACRAGGHGQAGMGRRAWAGGHEQAGMRTCRLEGAGGIECENQHAGGHTGRHARANEGLRAPRGFVQHEKNWVVWGLFAEIEIWTIFLGPKLTFEKSKNEVGFEPGACRDFFARVCPLGRADGQ